MAPPEMAPAERPVAPACHNEAMPTSPGGRSFGQRIRDHIMFSVVAMTIIFIALRLLHVRATMAGLLLSIALTLALNVGLSYYYDAQAKRRARDAAAGRVDRKPAGDIRFRE